uniref:Uncharacterized protein n=1 Tax=viral metagenome TaxID=1070528 RepID=A0A6C0J0K9_9ZZZZ
MTVSKFRKKGTRKNKKSNKKTRSKNKKSNKSTKKRIINKKRFLHKRGGRQSNPYNNMTSCVNHNNDNDTDNDNEMQDNEMQDNENIKINNIIVLIQNYILYNDTEYNTHLLNIEINGLDIDNLYNKIVGIINTTNGIQENGSSNQQLRRLEVIVALNNILVLVPENN